MLRVALLTAVLFVLFRVPLPGLRQTDLQDAPLAWLARAAIDAAVLSYVALASSWTGPRLAAVLFGLFFGMTLLSLLDAAVFVPEVVSPAVFVEAPIVAGLFAPMVVLMHARWTKATDDAHAGAWPTRRGSGEWAWRLALLAVA